MSSSLEGSRCDQDRRPCPVCGEMIVATAAKCRFCGEILDETVKRVGKAKSGKGKTKAELRSIAVYQRYLILCILIHLLSFVAFLGSAIILRPETNGMTRGIDAIFWLIVVVALVSNLAATVFAFVLTTKMSNVGLAILVVLWGVVPCVGLIALYLVFGIATNRLRNAGIDVGFLGADLSKL
jgi:hypothetical protein